jgi:hypothetical protein
LCLFRSPTDVDHLVCNGQILSALLSGMLETVEEPLPSP